MRVVFGVVFFPGMIPIPETGKSERDFRDYPCSFLVNYGTRWSLKSYLNSLLPNPIQFHLSLPSYTAYSVEKS
jgi:hypothetical protein